jgi:integrase
VATKRKRGNTWHYVIKRSKLLPRPIHLSFSDEGEGDSYIDRLEALLDRGIVPDEFLRRQHELQTVRQAILAYIRAQALPDSEERILGILLERCGTIKLSSIDYAWCENWIGDMKRLQHLAPSTIRHYVGALARCFDWVARRHAQVMPSNPLRLLPRRYASYSPADVQSAGQNKSDIERDRRLQPAAAGQPSEEDRIRRILAGDRPAGRQRSFELKWQGALECLFDLALETAMRLREIYTLERAQVSIEQRTVFLEKTKNGDKRQVPLSSMALAAIERYEVHVVEHSRGMDGFDFDPGLMFPWWDGHKANLRRTSSLLSRQFGRMFEAAGCTDLHFHDLRHEATCRLYERTGLSDVQIARITGHKDLRMLKRYANLRGSDLADQLW